MPAHDRHDPHAKSEGARPRRRAGGFAPGPRPPEKDESEVRWLISYSDFMMQLVCLFILLYSVSSLDKNKAGTAAAAWRDELGLDPLRVPSASGAHLPLTMAELPAMLRQVQIVMTRFQVGGQIRLTPTDDGFRLQLVYEMFDEGSATPGRSGRRVLDIAAHILHPYQFRVRGIEVVGNTTADPADREDGSDVRLSLSRAQEAIRWLSRQELPQRLEAAVLQPAGRGSHDPMADSSTPQTRAMNRRVDFIVHIDPAPGKPVQLK